MTLLALEGFDAQDFYDRTDYFFPSGRPGTRSYLAGRFGGYSVGLRDPWYFKHTASAQIFTGFAWYGVAHSATFRFQADGGTVTHVQVLFGTGGDITVTRGGVTIATAPIQSLLAWSYVEMTCTVSDTVGIFQLRVNGNPTPLIDFTGDTRNGGTSTNLDTFYTVGDGSGGYSYVDDMYICNSAGSVNNTFLGDVRVYQILPSAAGSSTQWTPLSGANYTNVDEAVLSTADYVASSNTGDIDLYTITDVPAGQTILGAQMIIVAKKADAGFAQVRSVLRSGATNYFGPTYVLDTNWMTYADTLRETDPATGAAWTLSGINAIEAGVQVQ